MVLTPSQEQLIARFSAQPAKAAIAYIRTVVVQESGRWRPICGRIDVARPDAEPPFNTRPLGQVRLVTEAISPAELAKRLEDAFEGAPFLVADAQLADHGMQAEWQTRRITREWRNYDADWPVVIHSPNRAIGWHPALSQVIEASGAIEAFDGIDDCLVQLMGFGDVHHPVNDDRFNRFQIIEWDYRGVLRSRVENRTLVLSIEPKDDPALVLAVVTKDAAKATRKRYARPREIRIDLDGHLERLNATLRHNEDVVCEALYDEWQERTYVGMGGPRVRSSSAPTFVGASTVMSQTLLGFMSDRPLAEMVTRDLLELDSSVNGQKGSLMLIGSILEAVLLDVLSRNEILARRALGKNWPDKASLRQLLAVVAGTRVQNSDGGAQFLLPPLTATKGNVVVEHRDLIHPRAEVRGAAPIDAHTVQTMRGVLGEVLRDLQRAQESGLLDAFAHGQIA